MKKRNILWGIAAVLVIGLMAVTIVVPKMQAKEAYEDYLNGFDALIDAGNYQDAVDKGNTLIENSEQFLSDKAILTLKSRINYASALEKLDFTNSIPSSRADVESARYELEASDGYGISTELLQYVEDNEDTFNIDIRGTLTIDHSKYKEKKSDDSTADGVSFKMDGADYFGYSTNDSANTSVSIKQTDVSIHGTVRGVPSKDGSYESESNENKPVVNEYECEGFVTIGFRKIDEDGGIEASNIEKIVVMHVELEDTTEEEDICTDYDAVFGADKTKDIEVKGSGAAAITGKGVFKDKTITVNFKNGIEMEMKEDEGESSSSSSHGSNSGYRSYNDNDYSPGSDWENYDSDNDGKINDKEYQDATNDYMDEYYGNDSSSGNDYSPGSDWENYDSDYDGRINDSEYQDAVGDYMDQYGY